MPGNMTLKPTVDKVIVTMMSAVLGLLLGRLGFWWEIGPTSLAGQASEDSILRIAIVVLLPIGVYLFWSYLVEQEQPTSMSPPSRQQP